MQVHANVPKLDLGWKHEEQQRLGQGMGQGNRKKGKSGRSWYLQDIQDHHWGEATLKIPVASFAFFTAWEEFEQSNE